MIKLNNRFAIGCLIQWYEIEQIELYLESVKQSLESIQNKENHIIDLFPQQTPKSRTTKRRV